MKRVNPFRKIYRACNTGKMADKFANLREFPLLLDIELTNFCNLRCLMCPTGRGVATRPKGFMSAELFEKIIREARVYGTAIRFVRWGEPLYHPLLLRFIDVVKSAGLLCHINTNAQLMDDEFISEIIRLRLDSIKFSFQGTNKQEYEKWRKGADFLTTLMWIKALHERRGRKPHPYIIVGTTVTDENEEEIERFKEKLSKYCDEINIGKTRNIIDTTLAPSTNYPNCDRLLRRLGQFYDRWQP